MPRSWGPIRGLVLATHPGPTVAVTAYATTTGVASGLGARSALLAAAVVLGQASVGWSNDWIDAPIDTAAGRRDKPIPAGLVTRRAVGIGAAIALVACVPTSLALGWRAGVAHLGAVASAWSYNLGLKRSVVSPLPYFISFGLVPVVVGAAVGGVRPPVALDVASGLLGIAAHLTNAVEDIDIDTTTGVRGLPQRAGLRAGTALSAAATLAAVGLFLTAPDRLRTSTVVLGCVSVVLAGVSVIRALRGARTQLFVTSILAVLPVIVAVAVTGGV